MIIDAHSHLGYDVVFDEEQNENDLIHSYEKYSIDGAIVQPFICRPYMEDVRAIHDRIAKLCESKNKKFFGMISIPPHFRPDDLEKEAERCVKELGFVGIKISPIAHATNPSGKDGLHVFEVARHLDIPVMIHTGIGMPFADPANSLGAIEAFPDVKTILAHAGSNLMLTQALYIAKKYGNVYLDASWLPAPHIALIIKTIGAAKLMFASDVCSNIPVELKKYEGVLQNELDHKRIMSGTAIEVFNLKI